MSEEEFNRLLKRINYYLELQETDNIIYDTFDIFGDDAEVYQYMRYTTNLQQENKQLKEKLDKVNKKINQYEIITGYYDSNYDGVEDTYSHDIKNELLKLLGDKE